MCGGLFYIIRNPIWRQNENFTLKDEKNAPEKETVFLQKRREMYIFVAVRLFEPSSVKKYS